MSTPRIEIGWRPLVRLVGRMLHSWIQGDRIRVSPTEGRLLGLCPPCYLFLAGQAIQVMERTVREEAGHKEVVYCCRTEIGLGKLIVQPGNGWKNPIIKWQIGDKVNFVAEDEIEVFPVK